MWSASKFKMWKQSTFVQVHGPPMGRGDFTQHGIRAGCEDLLNAVQQRVKPKICCFGHIHEGHGASSDGVTTFVNCAICDVGKFPLHSYSPVQPAIVIDLPDPRVSDNDETNEVSQGDAAATSLPRRSFTGRRVTAAQHVVEDKIYWWIILNFCEFLIEIVTNLIENDSKWIQILKILNYQN